MSKIIFKDVMNFGLVEHKMQQFNAIVPGDTTKETLESGEYWQNVAGKMRSGCDIRALADDGSFIARLVVLFVSGTDVRIKCESFTKFEEVDLQAEDDDYLVMNGGAAGWYVKKVSTGERVEALKGIDSKANAYKFLAEYKQTLAA